MYAIITLVLYSIWIWVWHGSNILSGIIFFVHMLHSSCIWWAKSTATQSGLMAISGWDIFSTNVFRIIILLSRLTAYWSHTLSLVNTTRSILIFWIIFWFHNFIGSKINVIWTCRLHVLIKSIHVALLL